MAQWTDEETLQLIEIWSEDKTWPFSDDIPLLSAAEVCELYVLCVQGGQKKQNIVARGTGMIKTTAAHP